MRGRLSLALAFVLLAGVLSAAAPASAAEDTCGGRGEAIIRSAYPNALAIYDGLFEIDGDDGGDVITPPTAARPAKDAMAELLLSDTIATSRLHIMEPSDECETREKTATAKHRLRYRDGAYAVPEELKGM